MTRNKTKQNYIKFKGVANHLDSLYVRMWAQFVITPEENYYLLQGEKVTVQEMDSLYPIVDLVQNKINKGDLADGRVIL